MYLLDADPLVEELVSTDRTHFQIVKAILNLSEDIPPLCGGTFCRSILIYLREEGG